MKGEIIQPAPIETILYPKNYKEREHFVSSECEFSPCGWARIEDVYYPLGYKVVTCDLQSLGLRKNPNILIFPVGEWMKLSEDEVTVGNTHWSGWGGVWSALERGGAATLSKYMMEKYDIKTRTFLTAMYRPLFANSYRIKSQGVFLLEEIY